MRLRQWHRGASAAATHQIGFTLAELLVTLTIAAVVLGIAVLRIAAAADRAAVESAAAETAIAFSFARHRAIMRRAPVAVRLDSASARIVLLAEGATLLSRNLAGQYGVRFSASRDSMAYDARGLGIGASNLSLVIRRGGAVETVFVSRLGRVRR